MTETDRHAIVSAYAGDAAVVVLVAVLILDLIVTTMFPISLNHEANCSSCNLQYLWRFFLAVSILVTTAAAALSSSLSLSMSLLINANLPTTTKRVSVHGEG